MGERSSQNLVDAIARTKENDLYRLIYALGIRHIGLIGRTSPCGAVPHRG